MTCILQPVWSRLMPRCEDTVRTMEKRGWALMRVFGSLGVDRVRSHLASRALHTPHEWWVWLDADMVVTPAALEGLVATAEQHRLTWLSATAVCRGSFEINMRPLHAQEVRYGPEGGLVEAAKAALACAVTHRSLFERLAAVLPPVDYADDATGERFEGRPFFLPIVRDRTHYGEDYSLALRARDAGIRVWCDTRVEVGHQAEKVLGWADAKGAQRV